MLPLRRSKKNLRPKGTIMKLSNKVGLGLLSLTAAATIFAPAVGAATGPNQLDKICEGASTMITNSQTGKGSCQKNIRVVTITQSVDRGQVSSGIAEEVRSADRGSVLGAKDSVVFGPAGSCAAPAWEQETIGDDSNQAGSIGRAGSRCKS